MKLKKNERTINERQKQEYLRKRQKYIERKSE